MSLASEIDDLENQITAFTSKAFVKQVGEITLNYGVVISTLTNEARRKLYYLANLCELDVMYDKFSTGSGNSPYSIRSLC